MPGSNASPQSSSATAAPARASDGYDVRTAEAIVRSAGRAPSIHNTQPWRWELRDGALGFRADRTRQLAVADPDGHSLLIRCGAALSIASLAADAAGSPAAIDRFPDPTDPGPARAVGAGRGTEPSAQAAEELSAALARTSDRRPFSRQVVD